MHISVTEAVERLSHGEVVAIPTETVYGLAADARNEAALQKIYAIKARPSHNPLIVHIADQSAVLDWADRFPALAQTIAHAFWPGPLTLVLKAAAGVSPIVTANQVTIALRVPDHPVTSQILKQSGLGLAAPSANRYTQISPTQSEHVMKGLGVHIPVVDGGLCKVGLESTIVEVFEDAQGEAQWRLLREGMISASQIESLVKKPAVEGLALTKVPGQHRLHYAPKTALQVCATRETLLEQIVDLEEASQRVAVLTMGQALSLTLDQLVLEASPSKYANQFYAALHHLDALGADVILVEAPPDTVEWRAIWDRLARAVH